MAHGEFEVRRYVLEVIFFGEHGWTSTHVSHEGARAHLEEKRAT